MSERVDVAIIGAGPYGLSLAAHLRAAGIRFRQFGLPMDLWRTKMPKGMYLKSQGFASNLSDPAGVHTLGAFCAETGREYADYGLPVSLEIFTAYGTWFAEKHAPDVEGVLISEVHASGGRFELVTEAGERMLARNVVVATGVEHFAHVPPVVAGLPTELCTHASAHDDLAGFAGRDVIVLGAGQSALETAALLHEHGAGVRVLVRKEKLVWNGPPLPPTRPLLQRLREPEAGLGSGLGTWFYSTKPWLYRRMTASTRQRRARTALGPAGAVWLRPRVQDKIDIRLGHRVIAADEQPDHVLLTVFGPAGEEKLAADHVIAATGYRPNIDRLCFLDDSLRAEVTTLGGAPLVGRGFASSVPGLYFAGPAVASSFGPVMRFVYGADFAAHALARRLIASTGRSRSSAGTTR